MDLRASFQRGVLVDVNTGTARTGMYSGHKDFGATPAQWVVVNTQPHRERIALANLAHQDFRAYCPMVRRRIRHARQTRDVLRPLFPNYLFVGVNPSLERWRPMLSTFGVRTLVRCGDKPSILDDGFVEDLQAREVEGVIEAPGGRPRQTFEIGQEVRLAGGPFDGLIAKIIQMDEKDRLVVLMDLLNRPTRVKVGAQAVAPLRVA